LVLALVSAFPINFILPGTEGVSQIYGPNHAFADGLVFINPSCPVVVPADLDSRRYCEFEIPPNGSNHTFKFRGIISNATLDTSTKKLTVNFYDDNAAKGVLLVLPRQLIDAKNGTIDSSFIVLLDGENANYTEVINNSTSRVLHIPSATGDHVAQIIGTNVVPEFPSMMVLALILATFLTITSYRNLRKI
jgi:hypothetical protein